MNRVKGYSEHTAKRIDEEVRRILTRAYNAAKGILSTNVHILHKVAATLMERESLDADEFAALVAESGPVPPPNNWWAAPQPAVG
jgi:cell division protease FtsH